VLGCFVREGAVDPKNKYVDQRKMDAIGRLGGHGYSRIRDQFDLPTMSVEEWERRQKIAESLSPDLDEPRVPWP
jgi:hypothetical protein